MAGSLSMMCASSSRLRDMRPGFPTWEATPAPACLPVRPGFQGEWDGVDAPALVGGHLVALALEHVPEMGIAPCAADLGPDRAERTVLQQHHGVVAGGSVETRPAAMGFEFLAGPEQLRPAGTAAVDAFGLGIGVLTRPRRLGPCLAQHLVFLGRQLLAPLSLSSLDLVHAAEGTSRPDDATVYI